MSGLQTCSDGRSRDTLPAQDTVPSPGRPVRWALTQTLLGPLLPQTRHGSKSFLVEATRIPRGRSFWEAERCCCCLRKGEGRGMAPVCRSHDLWVPPVTQEPVSPAGMEKQIGGRRSSAAWELLSSCAWGSEWLSQLISSPTCRGRGPGAGVGPRCWGRGQALLPAAWLGKCRGW